MVGRLVLPTPLQGIPMALFLVPLTAIILSGQPAHRIPAAAGTLTADTTSHGLPIDQRRQDYPGRVGRAA
ncbi:hypothetical protein SAMN06265784_11780 [Paraburkholderia susongensis]|uniref:Uncharacterized protein n=1 Tax=Paraburkholderia susongensis TaxID=1515439 RepID=A0A1X7M401_9BURK|nr:hypothetical protein SAMN06265784_11780 [Paraburkholderia susongensis]